jgi:hypothetical protein
MGKPDSPDPTPPREIAKAQTGTNISSAIANMWLGNPNVVGPGGSTTSSQTGTKTITDPYTGTTYEIPQLTQTTQLSAGEQGIYDSSQANRRGMADEAGRQMGFARDAMGAPLTLNGGAAEDRIVDLQRRRVDPYQQEQDSALQQRLADQGIRMGSEAYGRAMDVRGQDKNDAMNSMWLGARGQVNQDMLNEEQARLGRIGFFASGGQPQQPNVPAAGRPQVPTTDVAGIIGNNDQMQQQQAQMRAQQQQQMWGGLGGLFSSALFALSDERAKTDIEKVGKVAGHNTYQYRYKGEPRGAKHMGFMAQEVEKKVPGAVKTIGGMKHVDYRQAIRMGG